MTTDTTLPRIIRFDDRTDSGEFGATSCPHCGADGRYVFHFICEDGVRRGAMAGCIQRFPVSPVAAAHKKLIEKAAEREKKGWSLASWDVKALNAIESFYAGESTEGDALRAIEDAQRASREYQQRKYGRRR